MKLYKVEAVVLQARQMRDADRVLTLFSRQRGKIRVVAHGVDKPSSRKRGAVQSFCHSTFLLYRGREIDSIRQCEGIEAFPALRASLEKIWHAGYIVELLEASTVEEEQNEKLFFLLLNTLRLMSRQDADLGLLTRAFEVKLMDIIGLGPQLGVCVCCGAMLDIIGFSSSEGGVLCSKCFQSVSGAERYPRGTLELLRLLLTWDQVKINRIKVSKSVRQSIKRLLQNYIKYHLERSFRLVGFLERLELGGDK